MIMLTLFFTIILSWQIFQQFNPESQKILNIEDDHDNQESTMERLQQYRNSMNKKLILFQIVYLILTLALTVLLQQIEK